MGKVSQPHVIIHKSETSNQMICTLSLKAFEMLGNCDKIVFNAHKMTVREALPMDNKFIRVNFNSRRNQNSFRIPLSSIVDDSIIGYWFVEEVDEHCIGLTRENPNG